MTISHHITTSTILTAKSTIALERRRMQVVVEVRCLPPGSAHTSCRPHSLSIFVRHTCMCITHIAKRAHISSPPKVVARFVPIQSNWLLPMWLRPTPPYNEQRSRTIQLADYIAIITWKRIGKHKCIYVTSVCVYRLWRTRFACHRPGQTFRKTMPSRVAGEWRTAAAAKCLEF